MSIHIFQHYTFDIDNSNETLSNQNSQNTILNSLQSEAQLYHQNIESTEYSTRIITQNSLNIIKEPWIITKKFKKLMYKFNNIILNQYICIPCVYCGRIMYPKKCKWITYDSS